MSGASTRLCLAIVLCGFVAALSFYAGLAYANTEGTKREIAALENRLREALIERDTGVMEELYTEDLILIHPTGQVDDKAARIAGTLSREVDFASIDRSEVVTRVLGDTVVVMGLSTVRIAGFDADVKIRKIGVWTRDDGNWRMIASQGTFDGPPPQMKDDARPR